jgi:hypothetical protein
MSSRIGVWCGPRGVVRRTCVAEIKESGLRAGAKNKKNNCESAEQSAGARRLKQDLGCPEKDKKNRADIGRRRDDF